MAKLLYCFSASRACHHDSYYEVVNKIKPAQNIKSTTEKLKILFTKHSVILMDIDKYDIFYFPILMLRTLWGAKTMAISVRTEYMVNFRSIKSFLLDRGRVVYVKGLYKRVLFALLKRASSTRIYSIHKNSADEKTMAKFIYGFFYDPSLWDLQFLSFETKKPKELENLPLPIDNYILFIGSLIERRSRTEFLEYLKTNRQYQFLMSGNIDPEDAEVLKQYPNVFFINRYIGDDELYYLMDKCHVIYNFYTNQRPSGFFGRSMQMSKYIIVRSNSFLSTFFKDYSNLISVAKLDELNAMNIEVNKPAPVNDTAKLFDDAANFKQIIESL